MSEGLDFDRYTKFLNNVSLLKDSGKVVEVSGIMLKAYVPGVSIGSICEVQPTGIGEPFQAEVVGFQGKTIYLMPLGEMRGVGHGAKVVLQRQRATVKVGEALLGRIIDAAGNPIDQKGKVEVFEDRPIYRQITNPMERPPIDRVTSLGIRSIDGLLTVGRGQRLSIMAGSGVGKSMLLGMMARESDADVNVIALIGERGREVREFIEFNLGEEGLKKSIVIAATSDQNPLVRMRGAFVATAIAEYFSDMGKNVLLMMDSATRFAMAQREIGLSVGEPPASKGYTPSVFSMLPKLLERAGQFEGKGSITGLYSVLVEGDDMDDVIGDTVRSIVDGHIVLDRKLAQKAHFPAVDVLQSVSRTMPQVVDEEHIQLAQELRENLAIYNEAEDLINLGAYKSGSNPKIDKAIQHHGAIIEFLKQANSETTPYEETIQRLKQIFR